MTLYIVETFTSNPQDIEARKKLKIFLKKVLTNGEKGGNIDKLSLRTAAMKA
jgi:hypothetical protein